MILERFKLDNKIALIASYKNNWLVELASSFAQAGAHVTIAGADKKEVDLAAEEVKKLGKQALSITADLTEPDQVQNMVAQTVSKFNKIDILVNSFNLEHGKPFTEVTFKEWQRIMDINLKSVFLTMQAVGKSMIDSGGGRIINITSPLGERGLINGSVYCASMGGVLQLTRTAALEWGRQNIKVTAIGVGWREKDIAKEEDKITRYIPLRRRCTADDVAPLAICLASDSASYISGHVYAVDGGVKARG